VSGIGIAAFEAGGFIMDTGRPLRDTVLKPPQGPSDLPKVICRRDFPEDWMFVVAVPKGIRGLDEKNERSVLEKPETNEEIERKLRKIVLLELLPSIARCDIKEFGRALTELQFSVGEYFSNYQGGKFCCEETERIVMCMLENGAYGAGQSSWGPAAYGLVRGTKEAENLKNAIKRLLMKRGIRCSIFMTRARNRGFIARTIENI